MGTMMLGWWLYCDVDDDDDGYDDHVDDAVGDNDDEDEVDGGWERRGGGVYYEEAASQCPPWPELSWAPINILIISFSASSLFLRYFHLSDFFCFSVRFLAGEVFSGPKVVLPIWFQALSVFSSKKEEVFSPQMAPKVSWFVYLSRTVHLPECIQPKCAVPWVY